MIYEYYYCQECKKPLKWRFHPMCKKCRIFFLYRDGHGMVNRKLVWYSTERYQYYLSKEMNGWHPNARHRLPKELRTKMKIPQSDYNAGLAIMQNVLENHIGYFHGSIYKELHEFFPRLTKNIYYGVTIFYISHYLEEYKGFKSDAHFNGQVLFYIYDYIERHIIRRYYTDRQRKQGTGEKPTFFNTCHKPMNREKFDHSHKHMKFLASELTRATEYIIKNIPFTGKSGVVKRAEMKDYHLRERKRKPKEPTS